MQQRYEVGYSRYEQIAMDIAQKIVRGEYRVGQRLSGRSLLAGTYNVSPETIRRSIALLQNIGVVEAVTGSGVIVKSAKLAQEYLKEFNERQEILKVRTRINDILQARQRLDEELDREIAKIMEFSFQKSSILQQIEEVVIPPNSWLIGKSVAESNIRSRTGATVVAVNRDGHDIFSPGPDLLLENSDILIVVGTSGAKELVKKMVSKEKDKVE